MYAKLFSSLYQGTLRGCTNEILVFTNLLAHSDQYGVVDKHWRAIAEETGLSREAVEKAILNLEAPDPESRSPDEDGRRLVRIDGHRAWGWRIVNFCKYRAIRNEEDRREQNRLSQERWRNKNKQSKQNKQSKPRSAHTDTDTDTDTKEKADARSAKRGTRLPPDWELTPERRAAAVKVSPACNPEAEAEKFRDYWTAKPGKDGVKLDWEATWRNWCRNARGIPPKPEPVVNRDGVSPRVTDPAEARRREREALEAMNRQLKELGVRP